MFDFLYDYFTLESVKTILYYTEIFFVIYLLGYSSFLFISVVSGGNELFENMKKKKLRNQIHHDYYVPISIVVPAYNEEVTIMDTIQSLLNLKYKIYEIIIVNDGSKDLTLEKVVKHFNLHKVHRPIRKLLPCQNEIDVYEGKYQNKVPITLVDKFNGGKADAINMGINISKHPYFICMDADSILQEDSLINIATPVLENEDVIAVGSMIRVSNDSSFVNGKLVKFQLPKKIVPALQALEYERSFLASRIFLDKFNSNLIISGAFGLFKKDAVIAIGGYKVGSMGEDMELIVKLHSYYRANRLPYKIKYAYEAICWTQVPEQFGDLLKQRKRWYIGLFQSLVQHNNLLTTGSYLYYLFYELFSPFIELAGIFITLLAYKFGLLNREFMIILFLTYAVFGSMLTVISFLTRNFLSDTRISAKDVLKSIFLCIPENIIMRFILAWTRMVSLLFYRGDRTNWGSIARTKIKYDECSFGDTERENEEDADESVTANL
ncbi:glycosyltransferase family 2 protein [Anaerotignum sp. MB30-C6]|uniref:glycosyltransferase family 2 protein n=1 Tax=Anaerotignum sp. MB30-C6 TaxID=3070814 RepID=UPI0027DC4FF2|nr:glycosyltransferase [Anaerotignum sp. MB30-C6]WMI82632.1 glycosyltransferase [Anaerotignum sp. MB30-C6]